MAARADLDAVLHLGDYFYEYGNGTFPDSDNQLPTRMLEPPHETVTLDDYRLRYSLYRRDADLQELHRQVPFIVVWDDHESANNSWMGGAENHTPPEACPVEPEDPPCVPEGDWSDRIADARQAFFEWIPIRENPGRKLFRTLKYGDLADIIMLDTRIEGREEQSGAALYPLNDPSLPNEILGAEQQAWLEGELTNSTAKWKILGNQVVMGIWRFNDDFVANQDQWTGYRARETLMNFLRDNQISNVVVVTGDVHSSWAMEVTVGDGSYDPVTQDGAVAVEFVSPGITSPFELGGVANAIKNASPHIHYLDQDLRNGYFVLDIQDDKAQADWFFMEGLALDQGGQSFGAAWAAFDGESKLVEMTGPENDNEDTPPLAPA
jgi:alkaline phosphatase D